MHSTDFDILGHSGCQLTVCRKNGRLAIVKSTDDASYAERLFKQAQKQRLFHEQQSDGILTPEVFDVSRKPSSCTIEMEFVYGQNFIEFFEYSGLDRLNSFVETLLFFIQDQMGRSPVKQVSASVITRKYEDVKHKIMSNQNLTGYADIGKMFETVDTCFDISGELSLPVGSCHGDLTLSNMLFNGSRVYLIDFLDSFVETPLMDIVKLRQDTRYGWSFLMFKRPYDRVRHQIILDHIDRCIVSQCQALPGYHDYYVLFQLMNFLRILQYAQEPEVITFLEEVIAQLTKEHAE